MGEGRSGRGQGRLKAREQPGGAAVKALKGAFRYQMLLWARRYAITSQMAVAGGGQRVALERRGTGGVGRGSSVITGPP